ncbi:uncharacterized protein BDZ83DRAFT_175600 [Colletotrichum acutatum]|uniref:Uncharacterized protein n=1 Tax=Glomerella acutata TaxID=27357 RepID=A0AAD8U601_GLOAC|nr:uncharacterized protein BDZ83DRAFT_175600 [Colletotrichum acutatum]KAK1707544.1 hypothetical protein BDZ83DRAFT_175600 [Colletotrichum acutatum]
MLLSSVPFLWLLASHFTLISCLSKWRRSNDVQLRQPGKVRIQTPEGKKESGQHPGFQAPPIAHLHSHLPLHKFRLNLPKLPSSHTPAIKRMLPQPHGQHINAPNALSRCSREWDAPSMSWLDDSLLRRGDNDDMSPIPRESGADGSSARQCTEQGTGSASAIRDIRHVHISFCLNEITAVSAISTTHRQASNLDSPPHHQLDLRTNSDSCST